MPLYEYRCEACQQRFEVIRKFSDPELEVCTLCGKGPVTRLLSSPAIQFKGSGWYVTDYAGKSSAKEGATAEVGSTDKKDSSEGKDSASKESSSAKDSKDKKPAKKK